MLLWIMRYVLSAVSSAPRTLNFPTIPMVRFSFFVVVVVFVIVVLLPSPSFCAIFFASDAYLVICRIYFAVVLVLAVSLGSFLDSEY